MQTLSQQSLLEIKVSEKQGEISKGLQQLHQLMRGLRSACQQSLLFLYQFNFDTCQLMQGSPIRSHASDSTLLQATVDIRRNNVVS